jgi:hypothetical protein
MFETIEKRISDLRQSIEEKRAANQHQAELIAIAKEKEYLDRQSRIQKARGTLSENDKKILEERKERMRQIEHERQEKIDNLIAKGRNVVNYLQSLNTPTRRSRHRKRR